MERRTEISHGREAALGAGFERVTGAPESGAVQEEAVAMERERYVACYYLV